MGCVIEVDILDMEIGLRNAALEVCIPKALVSTFEIACQVALKMHIL